MAAYIVVDCEVTDPAKYEQYKELAPPAVPVSAPTDNVVLIIDESVRDHLRPVARPGRARWPVPA